MNRTEQRLSETLGLDEASLGPSSFARAIRLEMKRLGVEKVQQYERVIERSPAEWTRLLEAVLVLETWFFRDQEAFRILARLVLECWLPSHRTGILRLLSLPCSTGEEPFSAAMALLEAGLPPERFEIDAVDISANALAAARRALYGRNSFRNGDLTFRERYFRATKQGYVLDATVRERVRFAQGNLLAAAFAAPRGDYDFIFFRNLLIYLTVPARRKALDKVAQMLAPAGVVFVGPAEQPLVLDHGFESANLPFAFACRKRASRSERTTPRHSAELPRSSMLIATRTLAASLTQEGTLRARIDFARTRGIGAREAQPDDLECARRLVEAGRLWEATTICEAHLSQTRASAQAYYLMGVAYDAGGQPNAIDYFRKALYLEPNHYESLLQMALLASRSGDAAGARHFRQRAERLKPAPCIA